MAYKLPLIYASNGLKLCLPKILHILIFDIMAKLPHTRLPDSTLALLCHGYNFISRTCDSFHSDIFQTRLLLKPFYCMRGKKAAQKFYDPNLFIRHGAMPMRVQKTLIGRHGVQTLDDQIHHHRKKMFLSLLAPQKIQGLIDMITAQWHDTAKCWENMEKVVLFNEMEEILCRAVCSWAEVKIKDDQELKKRTRDFSAMIDGVGAIGPRFWRGRLGRIRTERWMHHQILQVRTGKMQVSPKSVLQVVSLFCEIDGVELPAQVAAVELMNVLRPTIAVARFITFAALALHDFPHTVEKLRNKQENYIEYFVQEVRRFYPFFPFIAAKVRSEFEWQGYHFPQGMNVMLDFYGTNHDQRIWKDPEIFRPERFAIWEENAYNFIPQGGGNHEINHRCPGEWLTIELMKAAVKFLVNSIDYRVPQQNLQIDYRRIPAIPESRFLMSCVKRK